MVRLSSQPSKYRQHLDPDMWYGSRRALTSSWGAGDGAGGCGFGARHCQPALRGTITYGKTFGLPVSRAMKNGRGLPFLAVIPQSGGSIQLRTPPPQQADGSG
jgi:hypothetical protein